MLCRVRRVGDTYNPGILEGNHVIDIEVASIGPGGAVVRALPSSRGRLAGIVDYDVFAVALQDVFPARVLVLEHCGVCVQV